MENTVIACCKNLVIFYNLSHPKTPLSLTLPSLPTAFGYFKGYPTETDARKGLCLTLDAFIILFAYLSFLLSLLQFTINIGAKEPSWLKYLRRNKVIHEEWLKLLVESPLTDFSRKRQGVIIDVVRTESVNLTKHLLTASVPVWFYWWTDPLTVTPPPG